MRAISILAILVLSTLVSCQDSQDFQKLTNCLNKETVRQFSAFFFDLYINKVSLTDFIELYKTSIKDSDVSKQLLCIREHGSEAVLKFFLNDSNSVLSKLGFTLLYESNCAKDIGGAALLLDRALTDAKDIQKYWKTFAIDATLAALVSYQGWNDCKAAYEAIKDIWSR
jgi:hypothetical protein